MSRRRKITVRNARAEQSACPDLLTLDLDPPICGCRWPDYCDFCAPIVFRQANGAGVCPECVSGEDVRTHIHERDGRATLIEGVVRKYVT